MKGTGLPPNRIVFSEKFACPVIGLHHRRNRTAPVQLQRAAWAPAPIAMALASGWNSIRSLVVPNEALSAQTGRGRALGQIEPAQPLLYAGAGEPCEGL
jgi:excinuclease ABC subunit A